MNHLVLLFTVTYYINFYLIKANCNEKWMEETIPAFAAEFVPQQILQFIVYVDWKLERVKTVFLLVWWAWNRNPM